MQKPGFLCFETAPKLACARQGIVDGHTFWRTKQAIEFKVKR